MAHRIPLVVIGGFLGAGKTTLLNRLLTDTNDRRIAALVNDFGPINVDADLIAAHDGETLSLTNGCICCSIGSGFEDGLIRVLERDPPMDLIVIEASGVSDPARIAQIGLSDPMLQLEAVIVMVDSANVLEQLDDALLNDTLERQIGSASLLVFNKTDLVARAQIDRVRERLTQKFGPMAIVEAEHGRVPVDSLTGAPGQEILAKWPGDGHTHDHSHQHEVPDHPFEGGSWSGTGVLDADRIVAALKHLPRTIIRAKGRVTTYRHGPAIIHLAGGRVRIERAAQEHGPPTNELIYIGVRNAEIHAVVREALEPLTT